MGIDIRVFEPCDRSTYVDLDGKNVLNSVYGTGIFSKKDDRIDAMRYVANDITETLNKAYSDIFKNDTPKKVIFNDPATIVYWKDGSKTVVKCRYGDAFDPEKGLAMAIAKHYLGTSESKGNYYDIFKQWLPEENLKKWRQPKW